MPNGDPLRQPIITSTLEEELGDPFSELERLKFLELLENALLYAMQMGQMTESEAIAIGEEYHTYLFEGEGQYIDPTTLPAYTMVRMFTPQRIKGREQVVERDKQIAKLKEYEKYREDLTRHWDTTREQARVTARGETARRRMAERQVGQRREIPQIPSATKAYYPFLEKLPTHIKSYFEPRFGEVFGKFEEEMPEARQKWWGAMHAPRPETASAEEMGYPSAGGSRKELYKWQERRKSKDPWLSHLEDYPFLSEFAELPPQERGFYPRKYRPPTRWLT